MKQSLGRASRPSWPAQLNRLGLGNLALMLLRAGQPVAPMLAQFLYIADPFISITKKQHSLANLGTQLEDGQLFSAMIRNLNEELK